MEYPILLSLKPSISSLFVGSSAASVFYGITSLQTFIYFRHNDRDDFKFKAVIFFLWVLDSTHLVYIVHTLYHYMVLNHGNPLAFLHPEWSLIATILITCPCELIVRAIFARRIWFLSKKQNHYPIVIGMFSLMALASGFGCASKVFIMKDLTQVRIVADSLFVGLSSSIAADFCIAASQVHLLVNSYTGFKRTDSLLNTLMVYAVNTCLFTTVCRVATLVAFAIRQDQMIFFGIYYVTPELSLNALLATLNARDSLRELSNKTLPLEPIIESDRSQPSSTGSH